MYEFCQKDLCKSISPRKSKNPPIMKKNAEKFSFTEESRLLFKNISGIAKTACVQRVIDDTTFKRIKRDSTFKWLEDHAQSMLDDGSMTNDELIGYIDRVLKNAGVETTNENRQQLADLLRVSVALPAAPPPLAYDRGEFDEWKPGFPWGISDDILREISNNKTMDPITTKNYGQCFHFGGHQSDASPKAIWQIVDGKIRLFGLYLHHGKHYDKQEGPGPEKILLK